MKRNFWRLATALIFSGGCFIGTKIWYKSTRSTHDHTQRSRVAVLTEAHNEVQRKSLTDFIWEGLNGNDELYAGEQIRTLGNSEAEIFLESSKATIRLEPNSLVVLEENQNGLSLDFLEGNLFVKGGDDSDAAGFKLKSCGEGKTDCSEIDLKSASMSLSRKGDDVSLEVFKGQAELKQNGKTVSVDKDKAAVLSKDGVNLMNDRLQLLSPEAGDVLFLNLSRGEQVDVTWKPLPVGYRMLVEVGANRSSLSKLTEVSANGEAGKLSFKQKPGKWFIRVTAQPTDKSKPDLYSMVTPFSIQPKAPPALTEPAMNASVLREDSNPATSFAWINRNSFESQVIEISKDPTLKSPITNERLGNDVTRYQTDLSDGVYYWRVTGNLKIKGKIEPVASAISKFTVNSSREIKPAILIAPAKAQKIPSLDVQRSGVTFKWQPSIGTRRFKISLFKNAESGNKLISEKETELTTIKFTDLRSGNYTWKVASFDGKTSDSQISETWEFSIDEMPRLEWADAKPEYEYTTPTPALSIEWRSLPSAAGYRFRVVEEALNLNEAQWTAVKQERLEASLPKDGAYQAIVEALDVKGTTIALSDVRVIKVKRAPLLPPPKWLADSPEIIKSDAKGNVAIGWQPVDGASNYLLSVETPDGKVVQEKQISNSNVSLARMKPGQYQLRVKSVDGQKRSGPFGAPKSLTVPNTSDIQAPKIKTMKVK